MDAKTIGNQFIEGRTDIGCAAASSVARGWRTLEHDASVAHDIDPLRDVQRDSQLLLLSGPA